MFDFLTFDIILTTFCGVTDISISYFTLCPRWFLNQSIFGSSPVLHQGISGILRSKKNTHHKEEDGAGEPEEHPAVTEDIVLPVIVLNVEPIIWILEFQGTLQCFGLCECDLTKSVYFMFLPTASEVWGKVMFSVFSQGGGYPSQVHIGGAGYPKVPTPLPSSQGRYPPWPGQDGGREYPKVPTPWPR